MGKTIVPLEGPFAPEEARGWEGKIFRQVCEQGQQKAQAYLEEIGESEETYETHYGNVQAGKELGLRLEYTLVSSEDDWDRYEGLQWYAAGEWARENAEDPDVSEVLEWVRKNKEAYLRWGRDTLGWAIYVFRKKERES